MGKLRTGLQLHVTEITITIRTCILYLNQTHNYFPKGTSMQALAQGVCIYTQLYSFP